MNYRLDIAPSVVEEARRIYVSREAEANGSGDRFIEALMDCFARIKTYPFGCQTHPRARVVPNGPRRSASQ